MDEEKSAAPFSGPAVFASTALVVLVGGCLDLCANSGPVLQNTLDHRAQWWIFLMVFGFAFPAVFASTYAALPGAFGLPLHSRQMVYLHYGFHFCGLLTILLAPFVPDLPQAPMGPFLVACGAFVFVANVGLTLRRLALPDAASAFLSLGCLWLVVVSLLGLPFAAEAPFPVLGGTNWSAGWLFLAIAGVCFNVLYGLGYRVLCSSARTAVVWSGLAVVNFGIAWVAASMAVGPRAFVLVTTVIFSIGTLIARAAFLLLRDAARVASSCGAKAMSLGLSLIPVVAVLLIFAVFQGGSPAAGGAVEQPAVFAASALDWAVALTALWTVVVPSLLGAIFSLQARTRISGFFAACYIVGAAGTICGVSFSARLPLTIGAALLALASGAALVAFLRDVFAERAAK